MKKEEEPICELCNTVLTMSHIMADCPLYDEERNLNHLGSSMMDNLTNDDRNIIEYLKDCYAY